MSKARDLADLMSTGGILEDGALSTSEIVNVTAAPEELNLLDGATVTTDEINKLDGVTATTAELNKLAGTTATTSDFDKLSNVTASATELNYMTGATSSIQSQLDNISVTSGSLTKSFTSGESATITLAQSITPAPVVSVTKEVAQTGQSSKGAWDVNATASNYDLHNTAYATTLTPSTATSLANSTYDSASYTPGVGSNGLDFSPDGTKVYILRPGNNDVAQYGMSTAWAINTINTQYNFSIASQVTDEGGMCLSDDGYHLYVGDKVSPYPTNKIHQYTLTTAYDLSTASFTRTVDFSSTTTYSLGAIRVLDSGTKLYLFLGNGTNILVRQYTMSTAYDVSTATSDNKSFDFYADYGSGGYPRSSKITSDGLNLFLANGADDIVMHYTFGTAWDVTTLSRVGTYDPAEDANVSGTYVKEDLSKMYIYGGSNNKIFQYSLGSSDALTLGTGSFASTDVGKRIQGNGGDVILTSTAGAYDTTGGSDFTDSSTIASGSWTMHGLKSAGDVVGLTMPRYSATSNTFNTTPSLQSATPSSFASTYTNVIVGTTISYDGLHLYNRAQPSSNDVYHFTLSTAFDLSTATYVGTWTTGLQDSNGDIEISSDGTTMYATYHSGGTSYVRAWLLNTAYYPEGGVALLGNYTFSGGLNANTPSSGGKIHFSPDGTKMYHQPHTYTSNSTNVGSTGPSGAPSTCGSVQMYTLSTAWNIWSSSVTYNTTVRVPHPGDSYASFAVSSDGKWLISGRYNVMDLYYYPLSTAFDISTQDIASEGYIDMSSYMSSGLTGHGMIGMKHRDGNLYSVSYTRQVNNAHDLGSQQIHYVPTGQYNLAVTNSGGQIDSSTWLDINSMTADQSLGGGEAYYAVSTDDRTTWSVAKGSDGVRPIVRDNAGTWQYNSQESSTLTGYALSGGTYDNVSMNTVSTNRNITFGNNGLKLYAIQNNGYVYQWDLSTAYDISTAVFDDYYQGSQTQDSDPKGVTFKSDGTKMYLAGDQNNRIYQYSLSTAWDIMTATYDSVFLNTETAYLYDMEWKTDGTEFYTMENANGGGGNDGIYKYTLTTAWDLSTASYSYTNKIVGGEDTAMKGFTIKSDGTKLYTVGFTNDRVYEWDFGTAWNITTLSYNSVYLATTAGVPYDLEFNGDGTKLFITYANANGTVEQWSTGQSTITYSTSATWTNATTNDEFYALQQALGATSVNRMDKTQLDAVADGSHFTLGNTLDLMIALKQDTASASLPTSDGVTINYDAESLNQGAVLGTDYDFDFPANNKVRITSNAAQNLKIRVV